MQSKMEILGVHLLGRRACWGPGAGTSSSRVPSSRVSLPTKGGAGLGGFSASRAPSGSSAWLALRGAQDHLPGGFVFRRASSMALPLRADRLASSPLLPALLGSRSSRASAPAHPGGTNFISIAGRPPCRRHLPELANASGFSLSTAAPARSFALFDAGRSVLLGSAAGTTLSVSIRRPSLTDMADLSGFPQVLEHRVPAMDVPAVRHLRLGRALLPL